MNFILTMIYMYFMLTVVYPLISEQLGINTRLGLGLFVIVSFLAIAVFNIFFYKKNLDISDMFDKTLFNSLIVFTSLGVISDLGQVNFQNLLMKYIQSLVNNAYTKNIVTLLPLLLIHLFRALLRPY